MLMSPRVVAGMADYKENPSKARYALICCAFIGVIEHVSAYGMKSAIWVQPRSLPSETSTPVRVEYVQAPDW